MEDTVLQPGSTQATAEPEVTLEDVNASILTLSQELQKSEQVVDSLLDEGEADMLLESLTSLDT